VLLLVVVVGGLVAGLILVRHPGSQVANPPPTEIAYIGSDGNVWEMSWPGGTPKQLTTDAQANSVSYRGPTWSPDGSVLAVERVSGQGAELIVLAPDGSVTWHAALPETIYNTPFAWSPDGRQMAYRAPSPQFAKGEIVLVNAQTGKTVKTLTYTSNQGGCGGGGYPPLMEAILLAHHSNRLDTFVWSPDQQNILVSQGCDDDTAEAVNVNTGAQTPNFPIGAHYQPGGTLLLGLWSDGTLGLTDVSAKPVRSLLKAPLTVPGYDISLGASAWSPDGKVVYFEHNNSIWRINADGTGAQELIAGTADDAQKNATAVFAPSILPDGKLLYAKAQGSDNVDSAGVSPTPVTQWYIAQADGSHQQPLPQGISDVVWRP
jgi:Tol biopolymer transport system component